MAADHWAIRLMLSYIVCTFARNVICSQSAVRQDNVHIPQIAAPYTDY
jgi:hypothetical protein